MQQRTKTLGGALLLAALCCSNGLALNPMGPPTAELTKGQWEFGLDYTYSQFGLDFDFEDGSGPMPDFSEDDLKMNMGTAKMGYGFADCIEAFGRVGLADVSMEEDDEEFDADGAVFGLGAKVTVWEQDRLAVGGLLQINWVRTNGEWSGTGWVGDVDLNITEIHVAAGPTYQLMDCVAVYGGPFWYYVDGEKKYVETSGLPGWEENYDLDAPSDFGGYIGAQVDLPKDFRLNLEFQLTSDSEVFGVGAVWRH